MEEGKFKIKAFDRRRYKSTLDLINKKNLHTVCLEANCPNRYECFSSQTATFMILGNICTRNCRYCNISHGKPRPVDREEPNAIAETIKIMGIKYAVITCVSRDDLVDHGAGHFVSTVREIKKANPGCQIELLISDLNGNCNSLQKIISSKPDVINHNMETVKELFFSLRPQGNYELSLNILKQAQKISSKIKIKSGIMVGLGETNKQLTNLFQDLASIGCEILTIGQYLQPTPNHAPMKKFYSPKEFLELKKIARKTGIKKVVAGTRVRSSYKAKQLL